MRKIEKKNTLLVVVTAMKSIKEVTSTIEMLKPTLNERFKVKTIGVFSSFIHGEQTSKSDVDVLVELKCQ